MSVSTVSVSTAANAVTRAKPSRWWFGASLAGIFVLAVTVRLAGSLRGAGLYGLGNYDDGVHFAAALGLVNGLLPYRDFLLLHPPGVVLILAPFAALSWVIGEPDAMAVARVSWMLLGGLNAVLCGLVLRPVGRVAGLVGGLFYALSIGAVYVEHTTLLEPPATTALLLALVSTRLLGPADGIGTRRYLVAGLLLGLSPLLKIWGVVAVLVVVVAILARRGSRPALLTLGGAILTCLAGYLPFFLRAPGQMWQMVVVAQVGRRRTPERVADRLSDILGVREWTDGRDEWSLLLLVVLVVVLASTVICLLRPELRVVAALMITHGALALSTPMWFLHYAGLTAAPMALTVGGALGVVLVWCRGVRWLAATTGVLVTTSLLVFAYPLHDVELAHRRFPAAALATAIAGRDGCVTTDFPMTLVQLGLLQRNIDRNCRFVVDLGGYSYYRTDSADHGKSRRRNDDWQAFALDYFRSGDTVIPVRFSTRSGFSPSTARELASWPVLAHVDRYVVRRPVPVGN